MTPTSAGRLFLRLSLRQNNILQSFFAIFSICVLHLKLFWCKTPSNINELILSIISSKVVRGGGSGVYSHPVLVSPSCSCALHQGPLAYGLWRQIEHTHLDCFHPRICTCGQLMILDTCGKLMNLQGGWYARWKALLIWRTRLPIRIPWYTLSNAFWKSRKRAWTPIGSSGELSVILNHFCDMHASVDTVKLPLVKECWFWFIFKSCLCI